MVMTDYVRLFIFYLSYMATELGTHVTTSICSPLLEGNTSMPRILYSVNTFVEILILVSKTDQRTA